MTYQPRFPTDAIKDALAAADARIFEAKNRARERRGLPPIEGEAGGALSDGTPLNALPEWRLTARQAQIYAMLVARAPMSLASIAQALHGPEGRTETAKVYVSGLRTTLRGFGIVIPLVKDFAIARPYMKPPTEGQAPSPPTRRADETVGA